MNDTELAALAALVNGDRAVMEATNAGRAANGYAMAYDDSAAWPALDALELELGRRGLLGKEAGS